VTRSFVVNALFAATGVLIATTVIGLVSLWPAGRSLPQPANLRRASTDAAEVVAVAAVA